MHIYKILGDVGGVLGLLVVLYWTVVKYKRKHKTP